MMPTAPQGSPPQGEWFLFQELPEDEQQRALAMYFRCGEHDGFAYLRDPRWGIVLRARAAGVDPIGFASERWKTI